MSELTAQTMAYLRLGNLVGAIGHVPESILDVGYGSGVFLKAAAEIIRDVNGYDVPPAYPIDDSRIKVQDSMFSRYYECVCFFDSLEHFHDIYEIRKLKTNYIYISLPWCHYEENKDDKQFMQWKHRKPSEHLWHFGKKSLESFMKEIGFEYICHSNIEDAIRKPERNEANILTALFRRR
nr:class I SAM-dependent methyltransferase [Oxalobacter paeniformigenes]